MWSDSWWAEERAARAPRPGTRLAGVLLALAGALALVAELAVSTDVAADELATRPVEWLAALVAIALGLVGPYTALHVWRAGNRSAGASPARTRHAALVAAVAAGAALAGLLLLVSLRHSPHSLLTPG